ncbi:MAG: hypothetical protein HYX42_00030 [Polaromonas sp.]|uniref:hypothetical protein n=1 Tax=Polaromonas sp. TaxID=1869339 RepID=UPI0025F1F92E|nr:hypothetical protein [Polaromonas sp.]MBI2724616.1 hypothetical protein [Polaromonas sp.]
MKTAALSIFAVLLIAFGIAPMLAHNLDAPDYESEWDKSSALQELRKTEAQTERRQIGAQKLCNQERGPNSEACWLSDGSLVCRVRNEYKKAAL